MKSFSKEVLHRPPYMMRSERNGRNLSPSEQELPQISLSRGQSRKSASRNKLASYESNSQLLNPKIDLKSYHNLYSRNSVPLANVISIDDLDRRVSLTSSSPLSADGPIEQDTFIDRVASENEEIMFIHDNDDEFCYRPRNYKNFFYSDYNRPNVDGDYYNNPFSEYINTCRKNNLVPMVHCFDSKRLLKDEIKMDNLMMGDKYVEILSNTIPFKQSKISLNMKNNRLTQSGADNLLKKLPKNIQRLNLSNNPSVKELDLNFLVYDYTRKLKELNIEGNNVGDSFIVKLCNAMLDESEMEIINLSSNLISNKGASAISLVLKESQSLTTLFLRWNNIQSHGAADICDALRKNNTLKVLELAFNPIGIGMNKSKISKQKLSKIKCDDSNLLNIDEKFDFSSNNECNVCENFKNLFIQNKALIHLDLSHCGFSYYECRVMNQGLKENHTILGLHMIGNKMDVDALGFLKTYEFIPSISHITSRISEKFTQIVSDLKARLNTCSNCWICEGWKQVEFKIDPYALINPPEKDLTDHDKVCLHLSFENFEPYLIEPKESGEYKVMRMIPPIPFNFYFTLNGVPQYKSGNMKTQVVKEISFHIPYTYVYEDHVNSKEEINDNYYSNLICIPRPLRPIIEEPEYKEPEWNIKESVFWGYICDTDEILNKCFEFDWNNSKIAKIIKDPVQLEEIRCFLKENYKPIRETYKYHAGISPCGNVPSIGQNVFNELINKTSIVDGTSVKLSDIDFEFIATNAGIKNVPLNPERWLVRYQFMEIFVRIAIQKYYKPQKDVKPKDRITHSQAVK